MSSLFGGHKQKEEDVANLAGTSKRLVIELRNKNWTSSIHFQFSFELQLNFY